MFRQYVSNCSCGTGTNFILEFPESRRFAARVYFRPETAGTFAWRFFVFNTVNSTFDQGQTAYREKSGGSWTILRAAVSDGGSIAGTDGLPGELTGTVPVTFGGKEAYAVSPDEKLWSDEVRFAVPEGHLVAFEWEIEGNGIPCTPDSQLSTFTDSGEGWRADAFCPMPALFGCDRPVKKRIAFLGDSITQGCGTTPGAYEMWAAHIAESLQPEYAVWNLGMGWGRGSDAAADGSWLYKAKQNDLVILVCGVNDLLHGAYGKGRSDTAGEVLATIETITKKLKEAGVEVMLATVPPFDFTPAQFREWRAVNLAIPGLAKLYGCKVYDLEAALDASGSLENIWTYGPHPNGDGGKAAADAFWRAFHTQSGWNL